MSEQMSVSDLKRYAQNTIDLAKTRLRELRRPLFRSNLDRDDRDYLDMHFRAVRFLMPYVEDLMERLESGEIPEDMAKEQGAVDALDIAIGGLDEFMGYH